MITCCTCKQQYPFVPFKSAEGLTVLVCPCCGSRHTIHFEPTGDRSAIEPIQLRLTTAKPVLTATRILDADRTALAADNADYTVNRVLKPNLIYVVQLDEEKGPWTATYKLQWKNTTDSGSFADLAATGEINYAATTSLTNDTDVSARACTTAGASGSTWQNGEEVEGAATSASIELADEKYTEVHFAINCAGALVGKTYDFQVIESGGGTAIGSFASSLIVTSSRELTANVQGASSTTAAAATQTRALTANATAASITAAAAAAIARSLIAAVAGASSTTEITATTATVRSLEANVAGASATTAAAATQARALVVGAQAASSTTAAAATQALSLTAAVVGASAAGDVAATAARSLTSAAQAASSTSSATATQARSLITGISGSSTTPGISASVARSLIAAITGASVTSDVAATMTTVRSLVAAISGTSATSTVTSSTLRALVAAISAASSSSDAALISALGVIVDPDILSLTQVREYDSATPVREYVSLTQVREYDSATPVREYVSATAKRSIHAT